ncbi:MAG: triphosphoribosyl-dephospho-CoA synthase [Synergistaceae bacterium]|jgi:triphosphoribosyl-dephospho-CoA synthase|nr:triphosphoribosyl-dephospho-CoA synthase [Synergistaceae bacterium]
MTDREIAGLAVRALILEASLAPKPGLVTPYDNGSHKDMDYAMLKESAFALSRCFMECAAAGRSAARRAPADCRDALREAGLAGEADMYRATGGVNTHKGAIYLLGFLCAALGRLQIQARPPDDPGDTSPQGLARTAGAFVQGVVERELLPLTTRRPSTALTAGERAYLALRFTGARGEVEGGYTLTLSALSFLRGRLASMLFDEALADTLFYIVARNGDTVLWARGGPEGIKTARELAEKILLDGGISTEQGRETIRLAEKVFVEKNLSPGGSADILSSAIFLDSAEGVRPAGARDCRDVFRSGRKRITELDRQEVLY